MWPGLRFASMAITRMPRTIVRPMVITARAGSRVESSSARARGITDGGGHSIRATDIIADQSAAGTMATAMLGADLKDAGMQAVELRDAVRPRASMAQRHAA